MKKLRSKVLAAVAATSLGWSVAAHADPYSDAASMYASIMSFAANDCSIWHHDPGFYETCVNNWVMMYAGAAYSMSNNLNPDPNDPEQMAYYYLHQMLVFGGSS